MSILLDKLGDKSAKAEKRIKFYDKNDTCPTCEQVIDMKVKKQKIDETTKILHTTQEAVSKLKEEYDSLHEELSAMNTVQYEIQDAQNKIRDCQTQITLYGNQIKGVDKKIKEAEQQANAGGGSNDKLEQFKKDLVVYKKQAENLSGDKALYEIASAMLKDGGIKSKIIKQYVPIMNKLVNKYLSALDFFVNFELDEEFNEIIKSRHRDEFSYASFSEGEKTRIDIALLLTWRAIAKLKNSTNTNLLILDEVFDNSLDITGTDELTKLLNDMSDTNVFIITHTKGDVLTDKFRSQIRFEKVKSFSRIAA
jgi:chromosome segregation ATPase